MCVGITTFATGVTNIPNATAEFYVNDFASVFSAEEKSRLVKNAETLAKEYDGIQVVVTTVKSLEGDTIENYAYNMYNQYGIGKEDRGLLILLATEDRQIRIEVGRAMESYINDAKAGRFIDKYAIEYLSENKFNEGLINLHEKLIAEIKSCVSGESGTGNDSNMEINIDWLKVLMVVVWIAGIGVCAWLVISIVISVKNKKREKEEYIRDLNNEITKLNSTVESLIVSCESLNIDKSRINAELETVSQTLANIQARYNRILAIYPDADKKVDEMILAEKVAQDKAAARRVDKLIASVIRLTPSKELVGRLETIKYEMDCLSTDEAEYLEANIGEFNTLYSKCRELKREYDKQVEIKRKRRLTEERKGKAADITKQLLSVISLVGIARASDLSRLREAKRQYDYLDSETQSYVDKSAISKIDDLLRQAKQDKERQEAEERKRRQTAYTPNTTSNNSGFGGRSGGGGASRRF